MEQRVVGIHRGQPRDQVGVGLRQSARRIGADLHRAAQRERNGGRNGDRIAFGGGEQSQQPSDPAVVAAIGSRSAALEPILPVEMRTVRSEEHTSELQSLMRIPYAVFCLKKK